jgi:hypothetical protein
VERLQKLAEEKEVLEKELFAAVIGPVQEAYKNNDLKEVLSLINILPEGSYMRMMLILEYNKYITSKPDESKAEEKAQ